MSEKEPRAWTQERIARLGFLVGVGRTADEIGADPIIRSTPNNIYRQTQRFGLSLKGPHDYFANHKDAKAAFDAAAQRRGMTRDELVKQIVLILGKEPALIDNILDDDA